MCLHSFGSSGFGAEPLLQTDSPLRHERVRITAMSLEIFADAQAQPHLFRWNGAIVPEELVAWGLQRGLRIPSDLLQFWAITGGGQIFETETLLKPIVAAHDESGVERATNWLKSRGLPSGMLVFHEGLCFTTVRYDDGAYLTLDQRARVAGLYESFDNWYVQVLRAEYAKRYGLGGPL